MQFLYPKSRQFPFDEVCAQIVRALQARNWKVPGFSVEFYDYGSGAPQLRRVNSIKSDLPGLDASIEFGRPQGRLPGGQWNDTAAVAAIQLAKRELRVYDDESGPTYCVYVGDNWERDRATWWTSPNARLYQKPRRCVKYSGNDRWRGVRATTLIWDEDDREYGPEGREPRSFNTAVIMSEFRLYLQEVILPAIKESPAATITEETCPV